MTANQVSDYVASQVSKLRDAKVQPLVQSVAGELECIRKNDERKAELDKNSAECNARIAEYGKMISAAEAQANELFKKLTEATAVAVS